MNDEADPGGNLCGCGSGLHPYGDSCTSAGISGFM